MNRAARKHVTDSHRLSRFFEALEKRVLMCSTVEELVSNGVPRSMVHGDGHISRSDYESLAADVKAHIDPHWIEADPAPVDYDKLFGKPLYMSEAEAHARGGPEAEALPDFFPQLMSGTNVTTTLQPGRALLRFGTQVNNQGAGPGSLISGNPGDTIPTGAGITSWTNPDGTQNVLQPVFNYTGSSFSLMYYRLAGKMTYHTGHGHFHYDGYGYYRLRQNNGGVPGAYVQRADGTGALGAKVGFCLLTFSGTFTTEWGQASNTLPGYEQDTNAPDDCGFAQGIRVGHYDQYSSSLEGQWIDVTGVPNGQYFVEIQLDAENAMLESNDTNNTKSFGVTLNFNPPTGTPITPDPFDQPNQHNDTWSTSYDEGEMGVFTRAGLNLNWGGDEDYFEFVATSSGNGSIAMTPASSSQGGGNPDIYLYDGLGNELKRSTNASGTDTIGWNFVAGEEYYVKVKSYNTTTSSNYQIAYNIKPTVNGSTPDAVAGELGTNSGTIAIARNGPVTSPLIVNFAVGGSATRGEDYAIYHSGVLVTGNSVTIGNLASVANLEVRPIGDAILEPTENVTLAINGNSAYVIGGGTGGEVSLHDTPPQVSLASHAWQLAPHTLAFTFTLDVGASLTLDDVTIMNLSTNTPVVPSGLSYDAPSKVATVTFAGALPDGSYRATLDGGGITHALGEPMGDNYVFNFFALAGDTNHDGTVNLTDFNTMAANFGQTKGMDASTGDFNNDGIVDLADFNILAAKFGTGVPRLVSGSTPSSIRATGSVFNTARSIRAAQPDRLEQLV